MDALNQRKKLVGIRRRKALWHPVKLTALMYLKEALQSEHYEICAEVIRIAKEFGADNREVYNLLEDPRRGVE